ncbi:carboxypeptidase regulatory-like domain-containing protein [Flaviaesturariibacter amylovorans]|uniref:VWFA domain-containing protein n=1 Tax=Flaviaesturariibacter amylovorans TaxID=1084520 RepID=A0ABP8GHA7_9BACT
MRLFLLALLLLWAAGIHAQTIEVNGQVRDDQGNGIPFATITETGTRNAVTADANGNFRIRVAPTARLNATAAGYEPATVAVAHQRTLQITLKRGAYEMLNEVVVTSLGQARRTKELGYSTAKVRTEEGDPGKPLRTWKRSGLEENSVRLAVGEKDQLPLRSVQVAVQVDGFRARVLFDYYFYNDRKKRLRGSFRLKLPNGASPCYLAFGGTEVKLRGTEVPAAPTLHYDRRTPLDLHKDTIRALRRTYGSKLLEARVAPKEKAAYAFGEVVRGQVDPALVEWAGADVFACSVYPLEPGRLHHVVVGYDINLLQSGYEGLLELSLPYKSLRPRVDVSINGAAGRPQLEPALAADAGAAGSWRYHTDGFSASALRLSVSMGGPVLLEKAGADAYTALSYVPDLSEGSAATRPADAVFLLDVSWSSQPDKFNIWLKTVESILRQNRNSIRQFAVLCFNVQTYWWRPYYSRNNDKNLGDFLDFADGLSLVGATDIGGALREAGAPQWLRNKPGPRSLFLLSDGDASWGEQNGYRLAALLPAGNQVFAFTTGLSGTDTRLLDLLSRQTGGAVFSVLNEEEVDFAARAIRSEPWRITGVGGEGLSDVLIAGRPYNIYPGQKLLVSARGRLAPGAALMLTLQQGDRKREWRIDPVKRLPSALSTRIYGQVAVEQLEEFAFQTEKATQHYSSYYDVAGKSCSFVMLENESLYRRFGLDSSHSAAFILANPVTGLVDAVLRAEAATPTLASAKAALVSWIERMKRDRLLNFEPDTAFYRYIAALPGDAFEVQVAPVLVRNVTSASWLPGTVQTLQQQSPDYQELLAATRREKRRLGSGEAFTLLSTAAESNREDLNLLRDVAFTLDSWQLEAKSYQLLRQVLEMRPAEPATYALLAGALQKMGRTELALVYYDIAFHTKWDSRFDGFDLITAMGYLRFLNSLKPESVRDTAFTRQRMSELRAFLKSEGVDSQEADLMVVITWNTDNTDVDLHLREPSGEECSYAHPKTRSGGFLSNDATDGFGPEMYYLKKAPPGSYHLDLIYYSDSRVETRASSKIFVQAYKNWGRPNEERFEKVVELGRRKKDADEERKVTDALVITFGK